MTQRPARRLFAAAGVAIAFAVTIFVVLAPTASAHDGEGVLAVESIEPAGASDVTVTVRLIWANDGHPAADATLTVTPVDPTGSPQTPVPMAAIDDDGRYVADVPLGADGTWTVRVTSVTPVASIEEVYDPAAAPTTAATGTSAPPPTTGRTDPRPTTTATQSVATTTPSAAEGRGDSSTGVVVLVTVVLVLVVGAAVVAFRASRRLDRP